jgi:hypothetical protein
MTSIRKFVYATLLALTSLNFAPRLASAQEMAHGSFTLTHDVHWQNAVVPAGDYRFSLDSQGVSGVLMLSKLSGTRTGFLLMVHDTEETKASDRSRLILESTPQGSYVSAMQLPELGLTLKFRVPSSTPEKQMAKAAATAAPSAQ